MRLDGKFWTDLIGLDYKFRGRGPSHYDCYGLLLEINKRQGIIIPDVLYETDFNQRSNLISRADGWIKSSGKSSDAVVFRNARGAASHCGIMIDDDEFIHATEDHQQVILSKLSRGYNRRVVGFYRYAV